MSNKSIIFEFNGQVIEVPVSATIVVKGGIALIRDGDNLPFEISGESDAGGGTIALVKEYSNDTHPVGEWEISRFGGTVQSPANVPAYARIAKFSTVCQISGVAVQTGYWQYQLEGNGYRPVAYLALPPEGSGAPENVVRCDSDSLEILSGKSFVMPNNTLLLARKAAGGLFGMLYLDSQDRTTLQLNNKSLRLSDADVTTDANGKITGIRAVVNGASGTIPFVQNP